VHVTEYGVVAPGETPTVPLVALLVEKPMPVQLVALVLLQLRSLVPPGAIVSGVAVSDAVTTSPTVTVAVAGGLVAPPAPRHVTE
jgi:hypothetical protein